ncbi:terminase small subunit, partial [Escherichia coli]|uniref:terminase small subunit n=1 Tax=Escherichia coli TaxID=562 RepID=UPI0020407A84
ILDGIPLSVQRRFPELENRHVDFLKRDIIKAMNKAAALDELITSARTAILAGCRRNGHGYPVSYPAVVPRSFTSLNPWRTGRPAVQMCFTA